MAAQCATLPTLTRTDESIVGTQTVTTEIVSTTTAPPTFITTTISTDVCTTNTTSPISSVCTPTFTTSVETVEGTTSLITLTSTIENPITSSFTTTLFTTSCTTPGNNNNNDPPPTPAPDPPTSTSETFTTETTSSTTLPNGSISVSTFTLITNAQPSPTKQTDQNNSNDGGPNIGAIAGGVVGGFVGLLALALLSWYFYKRSTSGFDRVFNNPDDFDTPHNHNNQDKLGPLDDEPIQAKGYQYGLLGNEMGNAPPGVNGSTLNGSGAAPFSGGQELGFQGPTGGNEMGYQPSGNDTGYQPDGTHTRNHSLAPLLGGVAGAAAGAAAYAVATTPNSNNGHSRPGSVSRPSTGGSGQALITPQTSPQPYGPQQGYVAQNTYPPQSQGYSRSSYYGSSDHNHSSTAYNPNPSLMSNPSVGSSSWAGGSSTAYVPPLPQGMMAPLVPGVAPPASNRPHSFDQDGRSGSPVSIQEQRVLQVINPDSSYLGSSPPQGSNLGSPSSPVGGSSGQQSSAVDGKGRPIDTRGQFVPLVHLDGGAYEEPLPSGSAAGGRTSESQPPAYNG